MTTKIAHALVKLANKKYRSGTITDSEECTLRLSDIGDIIETPVSNYLHIETNNRCYSFPCSTPWIDICKNIDKKRTPNVSTVLTKLTLINNMFLFVKYVLMVFVVNVQKSTTM